MINKANLLALGLVLGAAWLCAGLGLALPEYFVSVLILAGVNAIAAVSLNLVNGITGQFSLGHAGFMAVGAYGSAWASTTLFASLPPSLQLAASGLIGGCMAALAGWGVGLPSLRLRGDYLAIVTLGFGEIIRVIILNSPSLGGARGFINIPLSASPFSVGLILALASLACVRLMNATQGRALLAIREDEVAAEGLGVDTTRYKVGAFVASSFVAGLAGSLFAHSQGYLNPSSFNFMKSVEIVVMVVMGGMGSMSGAILAALALSILPEALRPLQAITGVDLRMVLYSFALIAIMLWRPQGLMGRKEIWMLFRRKNS